jgi:transposase
MFGLTPDTKVFVKTGATDGRYGIEALIGLVVKVMRQQVSGGYLFCFANRARNRIRLLWADGDAFWLATKRFEKGTVDFPRDDAAAKVMSFSKLEALLSGARFTRLPDDPRPPSNGGYRR